MICTPGRLIDHLNGTPNFTLQHLRFLVRLVSSQASYVVAKTGVQVVDEADRLLTQSFQDWLKEVTTAIQALPSALPQTHEAAQTTLVSDDEDQWFIPHHDALAPTHLAQTAYNGCTVFTSDFDEPIYSSCQKLLFSATLTSNPSKIAQLNLRDAKWFMVKTNSEEEAEVAPLLDEIFELPPGLRVRLGNVPITSSYADFVHQEHMVITSASLKPLVLFYLIHKRQIRNILVFTKSTESTVRLLHLFEYFFHVTADSSMEADDDQIAKSVKAEAFSSDLAPVQRSATLERFKRQEVDVCVTLWSYSHRVVETQGTIGSFAPT